jgi:DNA-binding MarR family transcriptional regulator
VFQLLGTAHSVTDLLAEALAELGLSPPGLGLLTQLAEAREPVPVAQLRGQAGSGDPRELVVMLERDGLVRSVTNRATHPRVTIALTSLGVTRQRAGIERFDAACRQLASALADLDSAAVERALSALR